MEFNEILLNGKIYKLVCVWRTSKSDTSKDIKGKIFPFPKKENSWSGQDQFVERLKHVQKFLNPDKKKKKSDCVDCFLCDKKCLSTERFQMGKYIWDGYLIHYIEKHNTKPPEEFIEKIWNATIDDPNSSNTIELVGRIKNKNKKKYLKLGKNQIMILDALMKHGGYSKKYYDTRNENIIRYSEHAGYIDIKGKEVNNIIVSGNTLRVDRGDEEIFLPVGSPEMYSYTYIFHTHPPTPKPGGRVDDGILYEFPSVGDLLHFIDHHNDGHTMGSLVMTPEGLYNIRKAKDAKMKIIIDEDSLYNEIRKELRRIQDLAVDEYGTKFTTYKFYSDISQNVKYINMLNKKLDKYGLIIDFYPRSKDFRGSWIVDTIYVPLY